MVFLSGQLPIDPVSGTVTDGDVPTQARQALTNALEVLATVGGTATDIIKVTLYLTDLAEYARLNDVYAEIMGDAHPARTVVEVSQLPRNAKVDVDFTAAVPSARLAPYRP
jgi:2-iminobutanoate/2-iminopropanoate deaminase